MDAQTADHESRSPIRLAGYALPRLQRCRDEYSACAQLSRRGRSALAGSLPASGLRLRSVRQRENRGESKPEPVCRRGNDRHYQKRRPDSFCGNPHAKLERRQRRFRPAGRSPESLAEWRDRAQPERQLRGAAVRVAARSGGGTGRVRLARLQLGSVDEHSARADATRLGERRVLPAVLRQFSRDRQSGRRSRRLRRVLRDGPARRAAARRRRAVFEPSAPDGYAPRR